MPPLLALQGSRWLVNQLEQLMTQLRARLSRLMAMRRESNERMADFAVADVSLFWLLNALNSAEPVTGNFTGGLDLHQVSEENQLILSVLDNMQRILNCRAGTLAHLPDYGLPDMTRILQGMPGTAHELMGTLSTLLLRYEPRLKKIDVVLLEQHVPGELRYAIDAELKGVGLVRYGTEFMPEGRVLLRHLKQQHYLDTTTRI
ncbi:type VI secretion system baseplate subunit TssE [Pantoea sp. ARC270]|nr:type VI secretion system baseplate subunit TssE [Pantoea sp. ARC270]